MAYSGNPDAHPRLVVIGASAGGLDPLEKFLEKVPEGSGWALVVIQHLSPDHRSVMDELLGRKSRLRILHVEDGLRLMADTVYLNPPGMVVKLEGDVFRTHELDGFGALPGLPIDAFFSSVSERDVGNTVGVILSGSGSDGALGARALRDAGAAVLVQSPSGARFSSMPLAAIRAGVADRVLEAEDMPDAIAEILANRDRGIVDPADADATHGGILRLLEDAYQVDFSAYRSSNVRSRVERRRLLRDIPDVENYYAMLSGDREELDELYHDLLIGVTEFYRDAEAMEVLRTKALDVLAKDRSTERPIRIWVPACASGEEAYTIAIELSEALARAGSTRRFRIIASDVHRASLEQASSGVYGADALARLPAELLARYFVKRKNAYVVNSVLRHRIIFSPHDVLSDPPFMNLDMISCRNLFIYLREEAQARVLSMFLFGLGQDGYLLLGASETPGRLSEEFRVVDSRWRLYRKASGKKILDRGLMTGRIRAVPHQPVANDYHQQRRDRSVTADVAEIRNRDTLIRSYDALLKRYAPSSILVAGDGSVIAWFGAASAVIDTMNNLADWTTEDIVHGDLQLLINVALEKLRQGHLETCIRVMDVDLDGGRTRRCTVRIEALDQVSRNRIMLVGLEIEGSSVDERLAEPPELGTTGDGSPVSHRIRELEHDLRVTEETLQHVTERLEASNEELQSSYEELHASNGEMQAANEELQSSNEEMQAVNGQLLSVNAELEHRIALLSERNAGTERVLQILNTGVIFVDLSGHILRFTERLAEDFELESHDVGRSLKVVGPRLEFVELSDLVADVIKNREPGSASGLHTGRRLRVTAHPTFGGDDRTMDGVLLIID